MLFSPLFTTDRTIFVSTPDGAYASTDLGEKFTLINPLTRNFGQGNPTAFATAAPQELGPVLGQRRVYLGYAALELSARVDVAAKVHQPVPGTPANTTKFAAPPIIDSNSWGPVALGYTRDDPLAKDRLMVFGCTPELLCVEPRFAFPPDNSLLNVRITPDGRAIVITTYTPDNVLAAWRSDDGGRIFVRMSSVDKLLASVSRSGSAPRVGLAYHPTKPNLVYLRLQSYAGRDQKWAKAAPPASQLFRSVDAGRSWTRIGFRKDPKQTGSTGTLPWADSGDGDETGIVVAPDGRLLALGLLSDRTRSTFCSVDGGVTWARFCPR